MTTRRSTRSGLRCAQISPTAAPVVHDEPHALDPDVSRGSARRSARSRPSCSRRRRACRCGRSPAGRARGRRSARGTASSRRCSSGRRAGTGPAAPESPARCARRPAGRRSRAVCSVIACIGGRTIPSLPCPPMQRDGPRGERWTPPSARAACARCASGCARSTACPRMEPHGDPLARARPDRALAVDQRSQPRRRLPAPARALRRAGRRCATRRSRRSRRRSSPGGSARAEVARASRQILEALPRGPRPLVDARRAGRARRATPSARCPGVGRKTAACVLLFAYGLRDVPVDTHVSRVGTRLGAAAPRRRRSTSCTTRCSRSRRRGAELELHVNLLRHGRRTCHARAPGVPRVRAARGCARGGLAREASRSRPARSSRSSTRTTVRCCPRSRRRRPSAPSSGTTRPPTGPRYDLVVVRSTWDYAGAATSSWPGRGARRGSSTRPTCSSGRPTSATSASCARPGLPVVPTMFVEPGARFPMLEGEVVVKPAESAGARDTVRFEPDEEQDAGRLAARIHASGRAVMVQPTSRASTRAARRR